MNGLTFTANVVIGSIVVNRIGTENYVKWVLCGVAVFAISSGITIAVNVIFYREDVLAILRRTIAGRIIFTD